MYRRRRHRKHKHKHKHKHSHHHHHHYRNGEDPSSSKARSGYGDKHKPTTSNRHGNKRGNKQRNPRIRAVEDLKNNESSRRVSHIPYDTLKKRSPPQSSDPKKRSNQHRFTQFLSFFAGAINPFKIFKPSLSLKQHHPKHRKTQRRRKF